MEGEVTPLSRLLDLLSCGWRRARREAREDAAMKAMSDKVKGELDALEQRSA